MTLAGFPDFGSLIICPRAVGTTCQDTPQRSLSQPHGPSSPPSVRRAQTSSISSWVSHVATNEKASVNENDGPPSKAVYSCPSSTKLACNTLPSGSGPPAVARSKLTTFEFGNSDTSKLTASSVPSLNVKDGLTFCTFTLL